MWCASKIRVQATHWIAKGEVSFNTLSRVKGAGDGNRGSKCQISTYFTNPH